MSRFGFEPFRGKNRWTVRVSLDRRNHRIDRSRERELRNKALEYGVQEFSSEDEADRHVRKLNKELPRGLIAFKSERAGHFRL